MIHLVEKEFFKTLQAERDKCHAKPPYELPSVRVMKIGSTPGYFVMAVSGDLKLGLSSSRKDLRRFAKLETARALLKSHGICVFSVADLSLEK